METHLQRDVHKMQQNENRHALTWRVFSTCFNLFFGLIGSLHPLIAKKSSSFSFRDKDIINFGHWKSSISTLPEGTDFSRWPFASGLALVVGRAPVLAWLPPVFSGFTSSSLFCKLKSVFLDPLASLSRTPFASTFLAVAVVPFSSGSLISL